MDILGEIAITFKDRVILLDKDLLERKVNVEKGSTLYLEFQRRRGRHYKNLKQGPGWSFPLQSFQQKYPVPGPELPKESPDQKKTCSMAPGEYEIDIPHEVREYFQDYKIYCSINKR